MTTVVAVMDRDGFDQCTDNIVVVDPRRRRLLWVPRDVGSEPLGDRINTAFRRGGHPALLSALAALGFHVDHSVCLPRSMVEAVLADISVTVPVDRPLRFWYPTSPTSAIEDGRRPVDFDPPSERLEGERLHQWIGARYGRTSDGPSSDLDRLRRQQVLLRTVLRRGLDLSVVDRVERDGGSTRARAPERDQPDWSDPQARAELARVRWWWAMKTADQVTDRTIDGRQVLVLASPHPKAPRWRRAVRRFGRASTDWPAARISRR